MYGDLPMMERDRYWNDSNPRPPYTAATLFVLRKPSFQGSTFDMASVLTKHKYSLLHTSSQLQTICKKSKRIKISLSHTHTHTHARTHAHTHTRTHTTCQKFLNNKIFNVF